MPETKYGDIVQKAVAFMQANLSQPITIRDIAKAVCYSPVHVRRAFRRITGRGILPYLFTLRLEQSRRLLRNTDLGIGEIAINAGFNNLPYFSAAFKRVSGMSPSQYRAALRRPNADASEQEASGFGPAEVFRDALHGPLSPSWEVRGGEWKIEAGQMQGQGTDTFELLCMRRLPENFRVGFESYFVPDAELSPSDLIVKIMDQGLNISYIRVTVGTHGNSGSRMEKMGKSSMWNSAARVRPGTWQTFALELVDDMFIAYWDGEKIFSFRDPFPGAYSSRCRVAIGSWKSKVRFRNFILSDLGIQPLVRVVRQGDMLFNEGLYEKAREFYLGLLESRQVSFNSMELYYKIGICFLRQGFFDRAREWFGKVVTRPENDFWSQAARLAEAETIWETGDTAVFFAQAEALSAMPVFHNGLRELLDRITMDLGSRGFYRQVCKISELRIMLEKDPFLRMNPQYSLAEGLWQSNRLQEAEALLREMTRAKGQSLLFEIYTPLVLADVYSLQGKWDDADRVVAGIESLTQEQSELALCAIHRARNLRGQGKIGEALRMLNEIPSRFPMAPTTSAFAKLVACLTYCAAGNTAKARNAVEEARRIDPASGYLMPAEICRFTYPPYLLERNFEQAANCLMRGGEAGRGLNSARYLIYAGIIRELSSNAEMAMKAYDRVVRLYPASRYCYYATLAQALQRGEYTTAFEMPYPAQFRSELFYLLGLLCEMKNRKDEALKFFRHSVMEDPTMDWPATLAQHKLLSQSLSMPVPE